LWPFDLGGSQQMTCKTCGTIRFIVRVMELCTAGFDMRPCIRAGSTIDDRCDSEYHLRDCHGIYRGPAKGTRKHSD